jgi:hypothetical protein
MKLAGFNEHHPLRKQISEHTTLHLHVRRAAVPSVFIPGVLVDGPEIFVCPMCKTEQPGPEHGDLFTCDPCGTLYEAHGNGLGIG